MNFKFPFTTDALEMTGVKSKYKFIPPPGGFDFMGEEESENRGGFDEREASPKRRQGRQQRRQQTGVVRTNESIVPQFVPMEYDAEIR